jgi:hypothetical protein
MEQYTYIQFGVSVLVSVVNADEETILPVAALLDRFFQAGKKWERNRKAFLLAGKPCYRIQKKDSSINRIRYLRRILTNAT